MVRVVGVVVRFVVPAVVPAVVGRAVVALVVVVVAAVVRRAVVLAVDATAAVVVRRAVVFGTTEADGSFRVLFVSSSLPAVFSFFSFWGASVGWADSVSPVSAGAVVGAAEASVPSVSGSAEETDGKTEESASEEAASPSGESGAAVPQPARVRNNAAKAAAKRFLGNSLNFIEDSFLSYTVVSPVCRKRIFPLFGRRLCVMGDRFVFSISDRSGGNKGGNAGNIYYIHCYILK